MTDDVLRWRHDTPGCGHRNHLNNAGAALMPLPVLNAMKDHLDLESLTGGYEAAANRAEAITAVYDEIAGLVGGAPRNMAVVASATAGFVQTISSFDLRPGDAIVTSRCDYTSYQIHYLSLAERQGVIVHHAPDLPDGGIDPDAVRDLLRRHRCRLVHVSWVPTNSGLVQDVASVGAVCSELGVPFAVDACQAVGQLPINVASLGCDYLAVTGRKFLRGPRGIGFLYASDRALARGDHPLFVDMRGACWAAIDRYEIADTARRFEGWEFAYALVLGLGAAARYARAIGVDNAQRRAQALANTLRTALEKIDRVRLLDRGKERCAIVTADVQGWDANELVRELGSRGVNTSPTLRWYAIPDFVDKGVESAIRISPHYYNTESEIDQVVGHLAELAAQR